MERKRLLIVEDDVGTLNLLELYFKEKGYLVTALENGEKGIEAAEKESFDMVILDIEMPGMNGFEVCKQIRKSSDVPIIFLSSRRGLMDKLKCFELGGDDYVTKPFHFTELEARVDANLRRYKADRQLAEESKVFCGNLIIDKDAFQCFRDGELLDLTPTELKILIFLANHSNQVLHNEQIYDHVWGYDSTGNLQTVKVHMSNLRQKLEKDPIKPRHIVTVRGFGYRFVCQ